MMLEDYNSFCGALPHSTHVVQWGGAHVWKIGGKVYAIAGWSDDEELAVTFKCSDMAFEVMQAAEGVRPAPYLASRGMKWLQRTHEAAISDAELKSYIRESYNIVAAGLTKKLQRELGFLSD
ncbi:MAG: MmcQ/YjbR family DNA-binding protein [Pseudomonadota bacterium]